ncbi:MAG: hypothetical protein Q4C82_01265 [Eubacteriales bacterium]|nr:hypothetical protein [Eubacteriales bacterium]
MKRKSVDRMKLTVGALLIALAAGGCGQSAATQTSDAPAAEETTEETAPETEEEALSADTAEDQQAEENTSSPQAETDAEDAEWIRGLYDALMADDFETVQTIMSGDDFMSRCEGYELADWAMWDYETAYRLPVSETECVGVLVYMDPDDLTMLSEIDAFVATSDGNDGFDAIGYGDKMLSMYLDEDGSALWVSFDGQTITDADGTEIELNEGEVYAVWHV